MPNDRERLRRSPRTNQPSLRLACRCRVCLPVLQMQDGPDPGMVGGPESGRRAIFRFMTDSVRTRSCNTAPRQHIINPHREGWFGIAQVGGMPPGEAGIVAIGGDPRIHEPLCKHLLVGTPVG